MCPIALDLPLPDLPLQALDRNGDGRDELVVMPVDGVTDRLLVKSV